MFYLKCARHSGQGGRGAADPGLHRRGGRRGSRSEELRDAADGQPRGLAGGTRDDDMHAAVNNGAYDVERIREDFPALGDAGLRQAAGLSRQRRLGAEAEGGARPPARTPTHAEYANVHRGLHYLANAATEAYEGAREKGARLPQCGAQRRDHLHPQRHRGDQSGRLYVRRASASRPATRSCSRSWSTTPTSCPGTSCASARAR